MILKKVRKLFFSKQFKIILTLGEKKLNFFLAEGTSPSYYVHIISDDNCLFVYLTFMCFKIILLFFFNSLYTPSHTHTKKTSSIISIEKSQ